MIIFFPGKPPFANDVAQWVKALLEGSFVDGVYFASKGFYEVHLSDAVYTQRLLETSPLFFGRQMVHVMRWSPNKDYNSLIRHHCPVWIEVVDFPDYMRAQLPLVASTLGQVICPTRLASNRNRFCSLWGTERDTSPSIAVEIAGIDWGEKFFKLKWGGFWLELVLLATNLATWHCNVLLYYINPLLLPFLRILCNQGSKVPILRRRKWIIIPQQ